MNFKKWTTAALVSLSLTAGMMVNAQEKIKDEGWNIPNMALGNGLDVNEKEKTQGILMEGLSSVPEIKGTSLKTVNEVIVDGDDLVKYVTDVPEFTSNSKAYSSALIIRTASGNGVNVDIMTPELITARTEAMYRSAAITSGVYDAYIRIASVKPMDGSGALAGIYKIYDEVDPAATEEEQQERDEKREVAQDQMQVISNIDQQNTENEEYSSENALVLLADIQMELQKINEQLASMSESEKEQEVTKIVVNQIQANGLDQAITPALQEDIVSNMVSFTNTSALTDTELTNQLTNFKDDIVKNGQEFKDSLLSAENVDKAKGFWARIREFFANVFNSIFNRNNA